MFEGKEFEHILHRLTRIDEILEVVVSAQEDIDAAVALLLEMSDKLDADVAALTGSEKADTTALNDAVAKVAASAKAVDGLVPAAPVEPGTPATNPDGSPVDTGTPATNPDGSPVDNGNPATNPDGSPANAEGQTTDANGNAVDANGNPVAV